jgi:hypothetical protein
MRTGFFLVVLICLYIGFLLSARANAAESTTKTAGKAPTSVTCRFETNDIGTIIGRGPSSEAAFEDAATKCFDRRRALYGAKKGADVDEETGQLYIEVCVNMKCS